MSHLPLKLSGPKEDGSMGVYTAEEIRKWIIGKLGLTEGQAKARGGSISSVVTDFTDGAGKATSGPSKHGGPTHTSLYHGNPVYHASAGKTGARTGITIFYVNSQGSDGKIIGIGSHIDSTHYEIEWHVSDWHVGAQLTLA